MREVNTTCAYCGVGCGVSIAPDGKGVHGDASHSANLGRLCQKGERLLDTLPLPSALRYPRLHGKTTDWDSAIALMAERFSAAIRDHGPGSVALYLSGQLLTEDYFVANKLAKGFWGTANVDTNSRLCMSAAVSAHQRAFGEDLVPGCYQDFEQAELVVLVGSNAAWTHPVLFQRLLRARESRGTKIVVIDPRKTATAAQADWHISLSPGGDLALFSLLLLELSRQGAVDPAYVEAHTQGLDATLASLDAAFADTGAAARALGLSLPELQKLVDLYRSNKVVTAFCQGVNQQVSGTDTINAIINCHLLLGQIGKPGCGPFSLTGQPNAMGGREVGALATQLACHLSFGDAERQLLHGFWPGSQLPDAPGLTATELFQAMADGKIKAVWIMATNPMVSLPDRELVQRALQTCPFVVVSDITPDTDTAQLADLLLPALGWSEKSGTVTNSERTISRQRAFRAPKGEARADWQAVCALAQAMGYGGFDYPSVAAIFREHAALSAVVKGAFPEKHFDISPLATLSDEAYEAMAPMRWPVGAQEPRLFTDGRFAFKDDRARFVPPAVIPSLPAIKAAPAINERPARLTLEPGCFQLNSGRSRDQWHTRTRTGHVAALCRQEWEPQLYLAPKDMQALALKEGDLVALAMQEHAEQADGVAVKTSELKNVSKAELFLPVKKDDSLKPGHPFVSMHWTGQELGSGVNAVVAAEVDPISRQPAFKGQKVRLSPLGPLWKLVHYGEQASGQQQYLRRQKLCLESGAAEVFYFPPGVTPASGVTPAPEGNLGWQLKALRWQLKAGQKTIWLQAWIRDETLAGFNISAKGDLPLDHIALAAMVGRPLDGALLKTLESQVLAGDSPLVCLCRGVSRQGIETALAQCPDGAEPLLWASEQTGCGSGCGSCLGEVRAIADEFLMSVEVSHG
ncbi:nitrate reductase [Shewanella cyperi]|uniref:nitrate reductase n=1 Tax=Shewanella cyperi TaxID=2814292 RepID=UPI001A9517EA|nr:molybdopterin-dependent oxidoreductase [Shewanella cyperi]QSX42155.1 molybdopterin-dependent oxidoreductase [Shewanella cyperi]